MAFEVETGVGLVDSNSYASLAEANAYFADRANAAWAALADDVKQAALIQATDYIDQRFGMRFVGIQAVTLEREYDHNQALEWPRLKTGQEAWDFVDLTETGVVPTKLKFACSEYALRVSSAPLAPDLVIDPSGVTMVTISQKAGPVQQDFATASGRSTPATVFIVRPYPGADMYLRDLVTPSGGRTLR